MAKNDPIKGYIAAEVKSFVTMFEKRGLIDPAYEVTVSDISPLESQVRVKMTVGGVRYFTVKVSEHY